MSDATDQCRLSIFSLGDYAPTVEGFDDAKADGATNDLTVPSAHFGTATKAIFETANKLGGEVAIALLSDHGFVISIATKPDPFGKTIQQKAAEMRQSLNQRRALNNDL